MLIPLTEPTAPRYIHINRQTNRVHLMVPVVGGQEISTDNTCKATVALKEFFEGGALRELNAYKDALGLDIQLLAVGSPERALKEDRLTQIHTYIAATQDMRNSYGRAMTAFLRRPSNLYSIQLRPCKQGGVSEDASLSFNINRDNDGDGTPLSNLYNAMYSMFPGVAIAVPDPRTTLIAAVEADLPPSPTFEEIQGVLSKQFSRLFGLTVDFTTQTDGAKTSKEYIEETMSLIIAERTPEEPHPQQPTPKEYKDGYIEGLLGACARDIWTSIPTPIFYSIPAATPEAERIERLSIMTQFFLANLNVYCKARGISTQNFGTILDESNKLSLELVSTVSEALIYGDDVEGVLCAFCNVNADKFGLTRSLNTEDFVAIRQKFERTYRTITATIENPHMDDYMLLDKDATGETAKFVTHQGSICVDFAEIVDSFIPKQDYFSSIRADFATHPAEIPHKNESIAGEVEVAIETLLAINEEQYEKLPAATKEAYKAHPTFVARNFLDYVAKGRQVEVESFLTATPANTQTLLRTPGAFTDYSGRTFNCTAYEYAYWAKDTHMCRMLERHMDDETKVELLARINVIEGSDTAAGQPVGLVYSQRGTEHRSAHFDLTQLVDALQRYVDQDGAAAAWMEVGILQREMPAHVANEYCRPDRALYPRPKFNEGALPRSLRFNNYDTKNDQSLFPLVISDISGLGINFALLRSGSKMALAIGRGVGVGVAAADRAAIIHLDEVRTVDLTRSRECLLPTDLESSHSMRV